MPDTNTTPAILILQDRTLFNSTTFRVVNSSTCPCTPNKNLCDKVGGATINQMYSVFNPSCTSMCIYTEEFKSYYPVFNNQVTATMFNHYPYVFCY